MRSATEKKRRKLHIASSGLPLWRCAIVRLPFLGTQSKFQFSTQIFITTSVKKKSRFFIWKIIYHYVVQTKNVSSIFQFFFFSFLFQQFIIWLCLKFRIRQQFYKFKVTQVFRGTILFFIKIWIFFWNSNLVFFLKKYKGVHRFSGSIEHKKWLKTKMITFFFNGFLVKSHKQLFNILYTPMDVECISIGIIEHLSGKFSLYDPPY